MTNASTSTASTPSAPTNPMTRRFLLVGGAGTVTGIVVGRRRRSPTAHQGGEVGELGGLGVGVVDRPGALGRALVPRRLEVELGVRVRWLGTLRHVDDDDGDVVATALAVGHRHQLVGGGLRVADRLDHLGDVVVADLVDEAVAAQEEAVAAHERQRPRVDAHRRVDAQRPGDDVAPRVVARLVVGDVAGGDELLHVAVVDGDATEPAVAQEVGARVADVDERQLFVGVCAVAGRPPSG